LRRARRDSVSSPSKLVALLLSAAAACLSLEPIPEERPVTSTATQPLQSCNSHCDCQFGSFCSGGSCFPDFGVLAPCYCGPRDCASGVCDPAGGIGACGAGGGGGPGGPGGPGQDNGF
jgi:hypothetical protein